MNKKIVLTLLSFFPAFLMAAPTPEPQTLDSSFRAAVARSEVVATQAALIDQAEEHYRQALGAVLPTVTGTASYTVQQNASTVATIFPNTSPLIKVTLAQPLFRGFRDFAGLHQMSHLTEAQRSAKRDATRTLFNDVAMNFFSILSAEKESENIDSEIKHYLSRIEELKARIKIGRSRITEMLTVEASLSSLKAQKESILGQLQTLREMYAFLTGLDANSPIKDDTGFPADVGDQKTYLANIATRPDVQTAALNLEAAKNNVNVQRGAHLPSADFTGNYYFLRPSGALQEVRWDVGVALTVPVFNGGILQSKVDEAKAQEQQSELALSRVKRAAEQEILSLMQTLRADLSQVDELSRTRELTQKNFHELSREYRLGLTTNLEVNQALTSYVESERALDRARYTAKLDLKRLENASGKLDLLKGK